MPSMPKLRHFLRLQLRLCSPLQTLTDWEPEALAPNFFGTMQQREYYPDLLMYFLLESLSQRLQA
ncbi:hypothetical protein HRbin15_02605 [bacterium HR15]|nr:hypothetical protein HRbin15_02605 [bacterium HR15]